MKEIPLTKGFVTLVDDTDFERLNQIKWHANINRGKDGTIRYVYAQNSEGQRMHRFILGVTDPAIFVDHEDHNTLNNQRKNLRVADRPKNMRNRVKQVEPVTSKFKGVYWEKIMVKYGKPWRAKIQDTRIGCFVSEETAARAYDAKAVELFGEFAHLNFPSEHGNSL